MDDSGGRGGVAARIIVVGGAMFALLCLVVVLVAYPAGTPVSSDPGAPAVPTWVTVLPPAVGILLALVLPRGSRQPDVLPAVRGRLLATTAVLGAIVIVFPLVVGGFGILGEGYVLLKLALFITVPAVLVLVVRRSVVLRIERRAWRWWAPSIVVAIWTALSQVAPWNPPTDLSGIDPTSLLVAATATAVTAGFGEEFLYRRLLQTRLEALVGPWPGIVLASLAFALMHLGSHGTGEPLLDIARVIVAQGSFGLFMGVLWWRYRNFMIIVLAHLIVNGWPVAAALVSGAI